MEHETAFTYIVATLLQIVLGFIVLGVVLGVPLLILLYFIS